MPLTRPADVAVVSAGEGEQDRLGGRQGGVRGAHEGAQGAGCGAVPAAGDRGIDEGRALRFGELVPCACWWPGSDVVVSMMATVPGAAEELGNGGFHDAGRGQGQDRVGCAGDAGQAVSGADAGCLRRLSGRLRTGRNR